MWAKVGVFYVAITNKKIVQCSFKYFEQCNYHSDKMKKDVSRRIILHNDVDILTLVTTHSMDIKNLQNNMTKISGEVQTVQMEMATLRNGLAKKGNKTSNIVNMNMHFTEESMLGNPYAWNFVKAMFSKFG